MMKKSRKKRPARYDREAPKKEVKKEEKQKRKKKEEPKE